ncbi:hypothetical protein W59_11346, partial [Rhodococcus opacus RKJ300 = JCM 13270]
GSMAPQASGLCTAIDRTQMLTERGSVTGHLLHGFRTVGLVYGRFSRTGCAVMTMVVMLAVPVALIILVAVLTGLGEYRRTNKLSW